MSTTNLASPSMLVRVVRERFRVGCGRGAVWSSGVAVAVASAVVVLLLSGARSPAATAVTVSTTVVVPAPERFGFNLATAPLNNHTVDPGFEPTVIRHGFVATGGGVDHIENSAGPTTSFFQTLTNGFFDGARVRVYRLSTNGPVEPVREAVVTRYAVDEQRVYLDRVGPVIRAGDYYYLEMQAVNPPRDRLDPRMVYAAVGDTWRPVGGSEWPFDRAVEVSRDASTVAPENGGLSCVRLTAPGAHEVSLRQARFSSPASYGGYYPELVPGRNYRVDVWMKGGGIPDGRARVFLTQHYAAVSRVFDISAEWAKYSFSFVAPSTPYATESISEICLGFTGPGTLWADNFLLYEDDDLDPTTYPALAPVAEARVAMREFVPGPVRLWAGQANTIWGRSLEGLTGWEITQPNGWQADQGKVGPEAGWTLPTALPVVAEIGGTPWIIVSPGFSEAEWLGLVEYLAAPYDPQVDTPATKPWAARRHAQGRAAPWTDAFERLRLEFGNETWNSQFQFTFPTGDVAGQFAEHFFAVAAGSPWYPAVAAKVEFLVNGWVLQPGAAGYGHGAAQRSARARYSDLTAYLSGWELGSNYGSNVTEVAFQDMLLFPAGWLRYYVDQHVATRDAVRAGGRDYRLAVYEGGPGYPLPAPGREYQPVAEVYGKSLAAGTATLDAYLYNSLRGIDPQAYFLFQAGANWSSHTNTGAGWRAHPSWLALQLRNQLGRGDLLNVVVHEPPVTLVPASNADGNAVPAIPNVPWLAVHAFREGTRYAVFLLSRRLDAPIPVTLRLPFTQASRATRHVLTGDPRTNNLTGPAVTVTTSEITDLTRLSPVTVPAASVVVLVFEGAATPPESNPAVVISRAPGQAETTTTPSARFRVHFSQPVVGFTAADVVVTGSAEPTTTTVEEVFPKLGTDFEVVVRGLVEAGTVAISLAAGAATNALGLESLAGVDLGGPVRYAPPVAEDRLLAYEGFDLAPDAAPHPPYLQDVATGFGWAQPWQVQNFGPDYAGGYRVVDAAGLSFGELSTSGAHAVGGRAYETAGRLLAVDTAFANFTALEREPLVIGREGRELWLSMLLRKDAPQWNSDGPMVHVGNDVFAWNLGAVRFGVGYFGARSVSSGLPYWSLGVRNATETDLTVIRSNVRVVVGETVLLVVRVRFGPADRLELFVNPPSLGAAPPEVAQAVWAAAGAVPDLSFRTVGWYAGPSVAPGVTEASVDELRVGETYAAVTPVAGWTLSRWQSLRSWPSAEAAGPWEDPDRDGRRNLEEYLVGSDPLVAGNAAYPQAKVVDGHLRVAFPVDVRAVDARCVIEVSEDLVTWETAVALVPTGAGVRLEGGDGWTGLGTTGAAPVVQVTAVETLPVSERERRFLRLRYTGR